MDWPPDKELAANAAGIFLEGANRFVRKCTGIVRIECVPHRPFCFPHMLLFACGGPARYGFQT